MRRSALPRRSSTGLLILLCAGLGRAAPARAQAAEPASRAAIARNEFVTVLDVTDVDTAAARAAGRHDVALVYLEGRPAGEVVFAQRGTLAPGSVPAGRAILIELEDRPMRRYPKPADVPPAFPRPGSRQVLANDRVVVWDYTFTPDVPSPLHFHDTDVVVVFLGDGTLASTTPDAAVTTRDHRNGLTLFNPGNRLHTETLVRGAGRVIVVELR